MVALTIPPTIGAAIRRITSEPVPPPSMIGSRPAMIAATVIMIGRTRNRAPSITACCTSPNVSDRPAACASAMRRRMAWFRYTSMTTPISTATPASAMKPTPTATDSSYPSQYSSHSPPISAIGSVPSIIATSGKRRKLM